MTSWIVGIADTHPQHWDIAKRHGFWDMTKFADISAGDTVYFWLTKGSLIGRTVATTSAAPITEADQTPWEDSGVRSYTTRFHFQLVSDVPTAQPRWGELQSQTGVRAGLNFGPQRVDDAAGEAWLASQFASTSGIDLSYPIDDTQVQLEALLQDDRHIAERTIALRQGQPQFRRALVEAYGSQCAVTRCDVVEVLEAAHISPFLGQHTNVVANGLLLRADIHTLFDRHLLTVTPDLEVRVAPGLESGTYGPLDGARIKEARRPELGPSLEALQAHNTECAWLDPTSGALFDA